MRQVSMQAFKLALALKKRAIKEGRNDEITLRHCLDLAEHAIKQRATQETAR
jgi:hypothetical protein